MSVTGEGEVNMVFKGVGETKVLFRGHEGGVEEIDMLVTCEGV